jgi:hypothetical protein
MPNFEVILIHIIGCNDCRANAKLEILLASYNYFSSADANDDSFNECAITTLKRDISELATHVHEFV